ncbi:unnamed protein product [Amoebophrya sp. A120]|nr:unnamed protein product [Amoebophrya sp. A120]|eukprot:GSA120T00003963001.1
MGDLHEKLEDSLLFPVGGSSPAEEREEKSHEQQELPFRVLINARTGCEDGLRALLSSNELAQLAQAYHQHHGPSGGAATSAASKPMPVQVFLDKLEQEKLPVATSFAIEQLQKYYGTKGKNWGQHRAGREVDPAGPAEMRMTTPRNDSTFDPIVKVDVIAPVDCGATYVKALLRVAMPRPTSVHVTEKPLSLLGPENYDLVLNSDRSLAQQVRSLFQLGQQGALIQEVAARASTAGSSSAGLVDSSFLQKLLASIGGADEGGSRFSSSGRGLLSLSGGPASSTHKRQMSNITTGSSVNNEPPSSPHFGAMTSTRGVLELAHGSKKSISKQSTNSCAEGPPMKRLSRRPHAVELRNAVDQRVHAGTAKTTKKMNKKSLSMAQQVELQKLLQSKGQGVVEQQQENHASIFHVNTAALMVQQQEEDREQAVVLRSGTASKLHTPPPSLRKPGSQLAGVEQGDFFLDAITKLSLVDAVLEHFLRVYCAVPEQNMIKLVEDGGAIGGEAGSASCSSSTQLVPFTPAGPQPSSLTHNSHKPWTIGQLQMEEAARRGQQLSAFDVSETSVGAASGKNSKLDGTVPSLQLNNINTYINTSTDEHEAVDAGSSSRENGALFGQQVSEKLANLRKQQERTSCGSAAFGTGGSSSSSTALVPPFPNSLLSAKPRGSSAGGQQMSTLTPVPEESPESRSRPPPAEHKFLASTPRRKKSKHGDDDLLAGLELAPLNKNATTSDLSAGSTRGALEPTGIVSGHLRVSGVNQFTAEAVQQYQLENKDKSRRVSSRGTVTGNKRSPSRGRCRSKKTSMIGTAKPPREPSMPDCGHQVAPGVFVGPDALFRLIPADKVERKEEEGYEKHNTDDVLTWKKYILDNCITHVLSIADITIDREQHPNCVKVKEVPGMADNEKTPLHTKFSEIIPFIHAAIRPLALGESTPQQLGKIAVTKWNDLVLQPFRARQNPPQLQGTNINDAISELLSQKLAEATSTPVVDGADADVAKASNVGDHRVAEEQEETGTGQASKKRKVSMAQQHQAAASSTAAATKKGKRSRSPSKVVALPAGAAMLEAEPEQIEQAARPEGGGAGEKEDDVSNGRTLLYIHCHQGCSRSATLWMAYVICVCQVPSLELVLHSAQQGRYLVCPNDGFLTQLNDFITKPGRREKIREGLEDADLVGAWLAKYFQQRFDEQTFFDDASHPSLSEREHLFNVRIKHPPFTLKEEDQVYMTMDKEKVFRNYEAWRSIHLKLQPGSPASPPPRDYREQMRNSSAKQGGSGAAPPSSAGSGKMKSRSRTPSKR